jgi:hypothetical protein
MQKLVQTSTQVSCATNTCNEKIIHAATLFVAR